MIRMNLPEPRAGRRDCPPGSDFSPEGSGTLAYLSFGASLAFCFNAVNMAAITRSYFCFSPRSLSHQRRIPTLQSLERAQPRFFAKGCCYFLCNSMVLEV